MDESTFGTFYRQAARPLWIYIRRVSGDSALADDIMQEAFFRFLRSSPPMTMDTSQTKSYLYKIATNLLRDHWRRQKRVQLETIQDDGEKLVTLVEIENYDISDALEKLSRNERILIWLAYVEGQNHREIARALGLKEKSIRVLLFRAKRNLARIIRNPSQGKL